MMTLGGIFLGTLLRRALPSHHLNDQAKDVVKDCVRLIATIAALVLGLLIGAARGSSDTQSTQVKQITANLILLDSILGQYGAGCPADPRSTCAAQSALLPTGFGARRKSNAIGPFEREAAEEQVFLGYSEALAA